tara:strand:- start:297 stop:533 length:237 start_codon:yes stop_codon:yes gene_type:complete
VEVVNVFGLVGLAIINASAVMIAFMRQQKSSKSNYGIKNGRGDLITQVGKLQDDVMELREDVAEMKGVLKTHIMVGSE